MTGVTSRVLDRIDTARLEAAFYIDGRRRSELGQFMTPSSVAQFMASLFLPSTGPQIRLLDAGAGVGCLSMAFLERWLAGGFAAQSARLTAYEIDPALQTPLGHYLDLYRSRAVKANFDLTIDVLHCDFIEDTINRLQFGGRQHFTHVILNPPYRKIHSQSRERRLLSAIGLETVNLYTGFLGLAIEAAGERGQIVAIVPRSFCNGLYYRPFREFLLARSAIKHIHLFASRDRAFRDDDVLQENIIIHLIKGEPQGPVTVSTSTDDAFGDYASLEYSFDQIVNPSDAGHFIHVPTGPTSAGHTISASVRSSLPDVGVEVSTGPVVDFRVREHLRADLEPETAPLLYPGHFADRLVRWPRRDTKKPNAVALHAETRKWLYPSGFYVVVRRFSAKEEKRRIVASVVDPCCLPGPFIGFENHLNVFHSGGKGLAEELAYGLMAYLNSTAVDECFRRFSGHTQVNATDLRALPYPSRRVLLELGRWARVQTELSQDMIDRKVGAVA